MFSVEEEPAPGLSAKLALLRGCRRAGGGSKGGAHIVWTRDSSAEHGTSVTGSSSPSPRLGLWQHKEEQCATSLCKADIETTGVACGSRTRAISPQSKAVAAKATASAPTTLSQVCERCGQGLKQGLACSCLEESSAALGPSPLPWSRHLCWHRGGSAFPVAPPVALKQREKPPPPLVRRVLVRTHTESLPPGCVAGDLSQDTDTCDGDYASSRPEIHSAVDGTGSWSERGRPHTSRQLGHLPTPAITAALGAASKGVSAQRAAANRSLLGARRSSDLVLGVAGGCLSRLAGDAGDSSDGFCGESALQHQRRLQDLLSPALSLNAATPDSPSALSSRSGRGGGRRGNGKKSHQPTLQGRQTPRTPRTGRQLLSEFSEARQAVASPRAQPDDTVASSIFIEEGKKSADQRGGSEGVLEGHHLWYSGSSSRTSSVSSRIAARVSPVATGAQDASHDQLVSGDGAHPHDHTVWDSYGSRESTPSGRAPSERL